MITNDSATVVVTDDTFAQEVESAAGLTVVDFWAAWCGPCRLIGPAVEQLAREYEGRVRVAKLDVDANPRTSARYNVRSLPSILFFKDGLLVDTIIGAVPKVAIDRRIQEHLVPEQRYRHRLGHAGEPSIPRRTDGPPALDGPLPRCHFPAMAPCRVWGYNLSTAGSAAERRSCPSLSGDFTRGE